MMLLVHHQRSLSQSLRRGHYHNLFSAACYLTFPLQAEVPPLAPPQIGYNYILNRVANIIFNVTERQPTKMLQVYPEGSLVTYLGKAAFLDITGLSNRSLDFRDFNTDTFQLTSHSVPFYRPPSTKKEEGSGSGSLVCVAQPLPLHELVRVTNYQGYFILGYPEPLWEAMGMMEALSNAPKVDFLSLQKLPIAVRDLEELPADLMTRGGAGAEYQALSYRPTPMKLKTTTTRKGVNGVEEKVEEEEEVAAIKYYIAVARKLRN
eukprot:gene10947-12171_t